MIQHRPSTAYILPDAGTPVVFDCRWNTPRRLGIGDKLIAIAAIQQMKQAGVEASAMANESDAPMFKAADIVLRDDIGNGAAVPWTDHVMCVPMGCDNEDCEAADVQSRHPVERALWGIGLDRFAQPTPAFRLRHQGKKKPETLSWSPIEISRAPNKITSAEWESVLDEIIFTHAGIQRIELLCAIRDQPEAISIVMRFRPTLAKKITVYSASGFEDWINRIASAWKVLTANTGAMWAAVGVGAWLTVCQRPATFPHMAMWQARREWGIASVIELTPGPAAGNATASPLGCPYSDFQPHTPKTTHPRPSNALERV